MVSTSHNFHFRTTIHIHQSPRHTNRELIVYTIDKIMTTPSSWSSSASTLAQPVSLHTLPTVLITHTLSFLHPDDDDDDSWMVVYARLCCVSKSWGNHIATLRMAGAKELQYIVKTGLAFGPLVILLRHCGAPVLEVFVWDNEDVACVYSKVFVKLVLELLAAGRAPKLEIVQFKNFSFDRACLAAFRKWVRTGHVANLESLLFLTCQFDDGMEMLMKILNKHKLQLPSLTTLRWSQQAKDALDWCGLEYEEYFPFPELLAYKKTTYNYPYFPHIWLEDQFYGGYADLEYYLSYYFS
jgi:hypothetical protein